MTETRPAFPWWIVGGGVLLAAAYLPTLALPFDFLDDGNLVYPTRGLTFGGHVAQWWDKVTANVEHLGPWRPTLWVHWEVVSNLCDENVLLWRTERLLWCALSAGTFLWLLHSLRIHPVAALVAGAIGMWNPYRNEIWLSLTLAEGVAMPYALFALIAARRAAHSSRPLKWDLVSAACVLVALGCKNTFAAIVPAQVLLRMWPDGVALRDALRINGLRALSLCATLLMPIGHFIYFKLNWHEGQYQTPGVTVEQTLRLLNAIKGAIGLEYVAAGVALSAFAIWIGTRKSPGTAITGLATDLRAAILTGLALLACGIAVYMPLDIISGRYTFPAVWGLDILIGVLLTALLRIPTSVGRKIAWVGLAIGMAGLMIALVGKQEKAIARANLLWDAVHYVEQTAPPGARVAWIGGDLARGELNIEEGIHFRWHLLHRGRGDVTVGLFDTQGQRVDRVELAPLDGEPIIRVATHPAERGWITDQTFRRDYRQGRRSYSLVIESRPPATVSGPIDPQINAILRQEILGEPAVVPIELRLNTNSLESIFPSRESP